MKRSFLVFLLLLTMIAVSPRAENMHPATAVVVDLTVLMEDSPDPVLPGGQLTWRIRIENQDPQSLDALQVVAQDTLPEGVIFQSVVSSQGHCEEHGALLTCWLGAIPSGDSVDLKIRAWVNEGFKDALLTNAVAVTSFATLFGKAAAVIASTKTTVRQPPQEKPVEAKPMPEPKNVPEVEPVIPKTIAISPSCVEPGGSLTLYGEGFDLLSLDIDDVKLGDASAPILAYSDTGIVVEVPDLQDGSAVVVVEGIANTPSVEVKASCNPGSFTDEDVEAGFIAGDVLIFFKEQMDPEALETFRLEYGFEFIIEHPLLGYHFAQLSDLSEQKTLDAGITPPVSCLINKRGTAPPVDVVLLVDRSGTMDESHLNPIIDELTNQMYCLVNRTSRIAVMAYNDEVALELPFAPWLEQSEPLSAWNKKPLQTKNHSDLERGLYAAIDYLNENARLDVPKQIMVITRGPVRPRIQSAENVITQAQQSDILIHGLALTSQFFKKDDYTTLRHISQGTGRDVLLFDERDGLQRASFVACSIVYGIYGNEECQADAVTESTSTSDVVTCTIAKGIYGVSECGRAGLDLIPSIGFDITEEVIERLNADPRVDEAFFNDLLDESQNDPDLLQQGWFLDLGLPEGWDLFFPNRGEGITLGIIDTGMDLSLAQANISELVTDEVAPEGLNFAPGSSKTDITGNDDLGHGTAVSAIAASVVGNAFNGGGVAPNANIIALKVFAVVNGKVKASNDGVAQALMNAFVLGVDVVNMSLGCHGCSNKKEKGLRTFYNRILNNLFKGLQKTNTKPPIIVAASGNDGEPFIDSPAAHPSVIAVGSVKSNLEERSNFSNYGPELDFVARGEEPLTTLIGGVFDDPGSGTSFASPQVAGLVALILAEQPGLSMEQVKEKIKSCFTVDIGPPGYDEETGWGRIWIPSQEEANPGCL